MKFASIIVTHYSSHDERSEIMRQSIQSLLDNTNYPYELIVVDNGGSTKDSQWLLELASQHKINCYVRNANNMHFGFARNQAIALANGDYIVIADNDILYKRDWLKVCIDVLEAYPDKKIYSTPVYNVAHWLPKFWSNEVLKVGDLEYRLNYRAGSNCFVIRREDLMKIGNFMCHRVGGTKWTNKAISLGYTAAIAPRILIKDLGFREGYNLNVTIPVKQVLSDGSEVYYSEDEFIKENPGLYFRKQKARICGLPLVTPSLIKSS